MAYIQRTQTGGNRKTFTLSFWVKRANVTDEQTFFSVSNGGSYMQMKFNLNEYLEYNDGPSTIRFITSRKFRDPSAWYHIVIKYDSTESVEADRFKMFINGTQETSFGTATYPGLNTDSQININTGVLRIGVDQTTGGPYYGEMSHVQLVDGTALDATSFGEVDTTSGIWKIKTSCYGTPGTNGFCLKMEDRTNLDLDSSSNAHTFTTTGTLTATYDNPSNNFCTLNPLNWMGGSSPTWAYGSNTYTQGGSSKYYPAAGTMGLSAGLWYWECKTDTGTEGLFGIAGDASTGGGMVGTSNNGLGYTSDQWSLYTSTGVYYTGWASTSYGVAVPAGNIVGVYLDLNANKLYFANNGTIMNSGTGISITAAASTPAGFYVPASSWFSTSGTLDFNFGNGYLATTAVTSPVADEGGIGAFEYDPSAGTFDSASKDFRAICTKNIKAYG
jgi:hypothetical protein